MNGPLTMTQSAVLSLDCGPQQDWSGQKGANFTTIRPPRVRQLQKSRVFYITRRLPCAEHPRFQQKFLKRQNSQVIEFHRRNKKRIWPRIVARSCTIFLSSLFCYFTCSFVHISAFLLFFFQHLSKNNERAICLLFCYFNLFLFPHFY